MKMILVVLPLLLLFAAVPVAMAKTTARANHDEIDINYDYNGSTVSVSGDTEKDVDLIIKIYSENGNEEMKVKDKVGGLLWMNGETVVFGNVPNQYFLRSTAPVEELLAESQLNEHSIGYEALAANGELEPAMEPEKEAELFAEFFRYKEKGSLYSQSVGGIDLRGGEPQQDYYTVFDWPYQAPPGDYRITVYAVRDGSVIDVADASLVVEEVGVEKTLTTMAEERGALYGIAAIIVAMSAGFGVGVIFKTGGGAH